MVEAQMPEDLWAHGTSNIGIWNSKPRAWMVAAWRGPLREETRPWPKGNEAAAVHRTDSHRSQEAAKRLLGGHLHGMLVTDAYASDNVIKVEGRQSCLAHLLRKAKEFKEALALNDRGTALESGKYAAAHSCPVRRTLVSKRLILKNDCTGTYKAVH
jgi:hypothetical protein